MADRFPWAQRSQLARMMAGLEGPQALPPVTSANYKGPSLMDLMRMQEAASRQGNYAPPPPSMPVQSGPPDTAMNPGPPPNPQPMPAPRPQMPPRAAPQAQAQMQPPPQMPPMPPPQQIGQPNVPPMPPP